MNKKVFCIIPAYNEEKNIGAVLDSLKDFASEIVVVNDGSSDNTARVATKKSVIVINHLINRGQGAALMTGNTYALKNGADIIVHFDADGQFHVEDIPEMIDPIISGGVDVTFGSRFLSKKSDLPMFKRLVIMPLAHAFNRVVFGLNLSDPQSGFRAMKRDVAAKLNINNDGAAHCSEIMYKVFKITNKVKEIPIIVSYNDFGQGIFSGKGRGNGGIKVVKDLLIQKIIE